MTKTCLQVVGMKLTLLEMLCSMGRQELALSMSSSDIGEHLGLIEGSDSSGWECCQERFPLLPKCVKHFPPGSQAVPSVGELGNFGEGGGEAKGNELRGDEVTLVLSQCPCHPCWCSAAWSETELSVWGGETSAPICKLKRSVPPPPSVQLLTLCQEMWGAHV